MKTGAGSVLLFAGLVVFVILGGEFPWNSPAPGKFSEVAKEGGDFELLENCRLIEGRNSDGDSFHVRHEKGETEFRLYFVDAPESAYRTYRGGDNNGKRLGEQGRDFGGLSREETVAVGREAKEFVLGILRKGDFEVLTKWEEVYGPKRRYCLVVVPWEGREVYLHELLVFQGLARVHTKGTDLPGGRMRKEQEGLLAKWERELGVVTGSD